MKILITAKEAITAKDGKEYVKCSAIGQDGVAVEVFTTKDKFDAFKLSDKKVLTAEEVKELFEKFETAEVEFNHLGRIVNLG